MLWQLLGADNSNFVETENLAKSKKIYEVLLEQEFTSKKVKDEIKALSKEDSAGSGGLTEKEGFHTLSPFYEFIFGGLPSSNPQITSKEKEKSKSEDEIYEVGVIHSDPLMKFTPQPKAVSNPTTGQPTKIPFNYRFQKDFEFRWDGSSTLTMPTRKLAGYEYYKKMLRQIEQSFAPPGGGNLAYRDMAGTVIREGISPGETKISFLLNDSGQVIDVKQISSQGQKIVDQACIDSIRGQNFGVVPQEVKEQGMIIGINFVFPRYR
jgi:outer membrane biosynthesis protein TonB